MPDDLIRPFLKMTSLYGLLTALMTSTLVTSACANDLMAVSSPTCGENRVLHVRIGQALLSVPAAYEPHIFDLDGNFMGTPEQMCERIGDAPIEARTLSLYLIQADHSVLQAVPRTTKGIELRIDPRPAEFDGPFRAYDAAVELLKERGVELVKLPRKHGFIAYDSSPVAPHVYIALSGAAISLDSAPLVIQCSAIEYNTPDDRFHYGRYCKTTYYSYSQNLLFRYKFYDGEFPLTLWGKLDDDIRRFVSSLVEQGG